MDPYQESLRLHESRKGKIEVRSKIKISTMHDLSIAYTPGVAEPCRKIFGNRDDVYKYTSKWNLVAVVSDGSSVLGLGNLGAHAAIPVMEGKAILFKLLGGVDAFPVCIDSQDIEALIDTAALVSPVFGGVNLEDIGAPRCFAVEKKLKERLDIPVFHDDQHGLATVLYAGLSNALKVVGKKLRDVRIVISGAGAAGTASARMLHSAGVKNIVVADSKGIIHKDRSDLRDNKIELAESTNPEGITGGLADAMEGADVFVGVSVGGIVTKDMVGKMADDAIVFALANPIPEIMPDEAEAGGARVVATGRSDFPNQINNALGFPGIFRGALDTRARDINRAMKFAAARAISGLVDEPVEGCIVPNVLDRRVALSVAKAVAEASMKSGAARVNVSMDEVAARIPAYV
ncbi:MAG TPA: NADP-dependent malic enzyme [Candidatus Methanoperedenaceae archaeon]|nr:NADP-dependent malic enzyme [Candidatus Methanoperedenaceae archaeon]